MRLDGLKLPISLVLPAIFLCLFERREDKLSIFVGCCHGVINLLLRVGISNSAGIYLLFTGLKNIEF